MARLFDSFFANRSLLSGRVFNSPRAQLHRLQSFYADRILPRRKPSSAMLFERRGAVGLVRSESSTPLTGHCLWMEHEGTALRGSALHRGSATMNRSLGRAGRLFQEQQTRVLLNSLHQTIALFR